MITKRPIESLLQNGYQMLIAQYITQQFSLKSMILEGLGHITAVLDSVKYNYPANLSSLLLVRNATLKIPCMTIFDSHIDSLWPIV